MTKKIQYTMFGVCLKRTLWRMPDKKYAKYMTHAVKNSA